MKKKLSRSNKVIAFLLRNNDKIQILLFCFVLLILVINAVGNFEIKVDLMVALLICIAFQNMMLNNLIGNREAVPINDFYYYPSASLRDLLQTAKHDVYIIAVTCLNMNDFDEILKALTANGVKVNFLLLKSPGIKTMSEFSYSTPEQHDNAIKDNTAPGSAINRLLVSPHLKDARQENLIEVRLLDSICATSFVAVDLGLSGHGQIQCTYYQYHRNSHECPCILFDEKLERYNELQDRKAISANVELDSNTENWFEYYKSVVLDMWENGTPWTDWKK